MNRPTTGLWPATRHRFGKRSKTTFGNIPWLRLKKKAFSEKMLIHPLYWWVFWKCGRKNTCICCTWNIYMTPNRRYMGDFFISTESYRISVIVKNTPKPLIVKAARLDLLVPQPTFWKGRRGEFRQYLLGTYPKWGNIPFRKSPSVCNPCAWNQPVFII